MPTSLGPAEILVILIVALIVLGPKRLPEAGRQVGKALAEVRRWTTDVKSEIRSVIDVETPVKSTVVEPVVVPGTATSVEAKDDHSVTDVVEPVTVAVEEPAIPVPTEPAEPSPEATPADPSPEVTPAGDLDGKPGASTAETPEPPSGDPARI